MLTEVAHLLRQGLRSLWAKGFFHMVAALAVMQVLALTQRVLLGRWLSLAEFGRFSLLVEGSNFAASLMTLGVPTALMRFGVQEGDVGRHFAGTVRILVLAALLLIAAFHLVSPFWQPYDDALANYWLGWILLAAPGLALGNYAFAYLTADKRGPERASLLIQQRASYAVLTVLGAGLAGFSGVLGAYFVFLGGFGVYLLWRYRAALLRRLVAYPYRAVLHFTGWDSVGFVATSAAPFLLFTLAERMTGDVAGIAQLAIAVAFAVPARMGFTALNDLMFPYLMEKTRRRDFFVLLGKVLLVNGGIALGVLAAAVLVVPFVILLLLGERFDGSLPLFRVLIVAEILIAQALLFEKVLQILGTVRVRAAGLWIALGVFALSVTQFAPEQGVPGAVLAYVLYGLVALLLLGSIALVLAWRRDYSLPLR